MPVYTKASVNADERPNRTAVSLVCAISVVYFVVALLFGRTIVSIVQCVTTILFCLEGYNGALRYSERRTKIFIGFLIYNTLFSLGTGFAAFEGYLKSCAEAVDIENCETQASQYGYVVLVGSGMEGFFLLPVLKFYRGLTLQQRDFNKNEYASGVHNYE